MKWRYFACTRCSKTFRTTIDNPDLHVECANCGYNFFHELTKGEYDNKRKPLTSVAQEVEE